MNARLLQQRGGLFRARHAAVDFVFNFSQFSNKIIRRRARAHAYDAVVRHIVHCCFSGELLEFFLLHKTV